MAETEKNNIEGEKIQAQTYLQAERDVSRHKWTLNHVRTVLQSFGHHCALPMHSVFACLLSFAPCRRASLQRRALLRRCCPS